MDQSESHQPIAQVFAQSVVEGSARYWAAHFTPPQRQSAVRAAFSFAHLMDQLTTVSPEVIAEKSVWWHEELANGSPETARHPVTRALLSSATEPAGHSQGSRPDAGAIVDAMHRHLHGALMSQQRVSLDSAESWSQYTELRFGTLHELVALASGMPSDAATSLGQWTAPLHALGVVRSPEHYGDARFLHPAASAADHDTASLSALLDAHTRTRPPGAAANDVLIRHELAWWARDAHNASPVFTGLPVGLRGMLASWRAARKATNY